MILDYLWRYPAYVNLLNIVDLVSVSYPPAPPVSLIPRSVRYHSKHSLHVGWRNMCKFPWFLWQSSVLCYLLCLLLLMYFILKKLWFTIHVDSWFWRIIDRICWACAIFRSIPNMQACTDRQTDGRTDRRTDGRTHGQINPGWVG